MAVQDLLSQDEIDALLHGVDDGLVQTESASEPGSIKSYDLTSQDRIVRGRMPTLEMINERFARYTRISMFNLLRRSADVAVGGVQVMKFGEYVHSLYVPTSLNLVMLFSGQGFDTLATPVGQEMLRQKATASVQEVAQKEVGKLVVDQLLFTNFVLQ